MASEAHISTVFMHLKNYLMWILIIHKGSLILNIYCRSIYCYVESECGENTSNDNTRTANQQLLVNSSWTGMENELINYNNRKKKHIHWIGQEKLVHPSAGSHKENGTLLLPASLCVPLEIGQSSYSLFHHG